MPDPRPRHSRALGRAIVDMLKPTSALTLRCTPPRPQRCPVTPLRSKTLQPEMSGKVDGRRPAPMARAEGAPKKKQNGLFPQGTASYQIWTDRPEPLYHMDRTLPFGLNGAFGGRLRRTEPSPARRAPGAVRINTIANDSGRTKLPNPRAPPMPSDAD